MAKCISPKPQPFDPTKGPAADHFKKTICQELGHLSNFTTWGPDAFHMPFIEILIGFWGVHREACVVEGAHSRALKGILSVLDS